MGLGSQGPGSWPEPEAAARPTEPPRGPEILILEVMLLGLRKPFVCVCFKDFIYLFMRDTEREGEAGSLQEARCGS